MNKHFNNFDEPYNVVQCREFTVGSLVIGGLFFYAMYKMCADATKNAMNQHERDTNLLHQQVLKTLKEMENEKTNEVKLQKLKLKEEIKAEKRRLKAEIKAEKRRAKEEQPST